MSEPEQSRREAAADHLVSRYEELRRRFRSSDISHGMGLNLFLHHGMKIWMDAWSRYALGYAKAEQSSEEIFSIDLQSDMAIILAGMVLNAWQKEARC